MYLSASEQATVNFYKWEYRCRGYYHFDEKVHIEPPFVPFRFQNISEIPFIDDGRVPSLIDRITSFINPKSKETEEVTEEEETLLPNPVLKIPKNTGFSITFPKGEEISLIISTEFLNMLSFTDSPLSFEILGTYETITIQIVCSTNDSARVQSHLKAYFTNIIIRDIPFFDFGFDKKELIAIGDFGLSAEFMRPIETPKTFGIDPLTSITATLDTLQFGDTAVFQIIFQGVSAPWSESIMYSVSDGQGGSFFSDSPEMLNCAKDKVSAPLFSCIVRIATQGNSDNRSQYLATELARSITSVSTSQYNTLIPLNNEGYNYDSHLYNLYHRTSNRPGMLLNSNELVLFVHYPNKSIISSKIGLQGGKTKALPSENKNQKYVLGINEHNGIETKVCIDDEARLRHTHIIGATGVGKSTLIANMVFEDIKHGNGCALFDPHGDIVEDILARIPEHRKNDVIIIDPSDSEFPIGFNLLGAKTDVEKIVLSSDLVSVFKRHATAWGDNMTAVLSNAINAFLENSKGGTLIELKRFLLEERFREQFLENVEDQSIHYYWQYEYPMVKKGIAPLLTRIDTFLRPKILRYMLAQNKGVDFRACIEEKKIVLIKLSQGLIGEDNSYLLGSLFLSKFNQVALGRQSLSKEERHPFYIYLDEFQNFITPSITSILSGARKYGLGLVLAHQELGQIDDTKTLNSVISNPHIRICFRLGDNDAKKLESGFSYFEQEDLQSLGIGEAIMRIGSSKNDFNITTYQIPKIDIKTSETIREYIIQNTRNKYSKDSSEIKSLLESLLPKIKNKSSLKKEIDKPIQIQKEKIDNKTSSQTPIVSKNEEVLSEIKTEKSLAPFDKQKAVYLKQAEEQEVLRKHRSLQYFVRSMATQRGFKATLEEETNNGGRVDVGLLKDEIRIAIEISVTNTVEYEVKNIQKCINNGYSLIYMISDDSKHLLNIKKEALDVIDKKQYSKIHFFPSQELTLYLDALNPKSITKEKRVRGYRIKVNYKSGNIDTSKQKSITNIIMDSLRKK